MTAKRKNWWSDHGATIAGLLTALGTAWATIDWTTFDVKRDWPKLAVSAAIAIGGWLSKFKIKENEVSK